MNRLVLWLSVHHHHFLLCVKSTNHLQVLPGQTLEFLLQPLQRLGQVVVPLTQQLVLVQHGLALLLRLTHTLQLGGERHKEDKEQGRERGEGGLMHW